MTEKKRDLNLDLIRAAALFFTVGMHFMDNSGLYELEIRGALPVLAACLRMLFTACVPMFLMLSGFLCRKRTLSKRYYLRVLRILETYLIASALCLLYRALIAGEAVDLRMVFGSVVNFYASGYAWYVMMYLGLFLLMPFLNLAFNGLETRRQRLVLIGSFFVLSHLPTLLNFRIQLLSVWWKNLYPVTYYFTGAYLAEYRPRLPAKKALGLLAALLPLSVLSARFAYGASGAHLIGMTYDHGAVYAVSLACFVTLYTLKTAHLPARLAAFIGWVSRLSFGAYLLSWVSDGLLYPVFIRLVPAFEARLPWALPVTALSLAIALPLAQLSEWLRLPLDKLVRRALAGTER